MNRLLLSLAALLANLGAASAAPAPNVIVFFIDDLGWTDLGCYGSTFYETPNLDQLASSGVRFTHSYSANPVCSPTRAAAMTGKAPQRVGITQWIPQPSDITLPKEETTLGEAFREAGYTTGYTGKWHLGEKDDQLPNSHGFTWMKATNRAGQPASYFYPYAKKNKRGSYWNVPDLSSGEPGDYLSDALTDQAIHFIDRHQAQPFFLYLAHYAVHTPIQAPKPLVTKYQKKRKQRYGDSPTPTVPGPHETVSRGRQDHPAYAAMIENLDRNIGRVLDRVKQLGLEENTIIVFTSDNGGHCHLKNSPGVTSNLPLRSGKGWTYEGGIRIPTIIAWPGKIAPATSQVPSITMDLFPTLLELSGQPLLPEQHLDGRSLVSALDGQPKAALKSRALYWTYPHAHGSGHQPSHAIQKDGWKLIHFDADQSDALYHLERDIREQHDLAGKHPEKVQALREELMDWIKKTTP